jgi:hypothetical protein
MASVGPTVSNDDQSNKSSNQHIPKHFQHQPLQTIKRPTTTHQKFSHFKLPNPREQPQANSNIFPKKWGMRSKDKYGH